LKSAVGFIEAAWPLVVAGLCVAVGALAGGVGPHHEPAAYTVWYGAFGAAAVAIGFRRQHPFRTPAGMIWVLGATGAVMALQMRAYGAVVPLAALMIALFVALAVATGRSWRALPAVIVAVAALWPIGVASLRLANPDYDQLARDVGLTLRNWELDRYAALFGPPFADGVPMREGLMPWAKSEARRRVVCLGNSTTWGERLAVNEAYPAHLAAELGPGFEVGNAGLDKAFHSLQLRLYYERVLRKLRADVLVLYYSGDEISLNYATGAYWRFANAVYTKGPLREICRRGEGNLAFHLRWAQAYHLTVALGGEIPPRHVDWLPPELEKMAAIAQADGTRIVLAPEIKRAGGPLRPATVAVMKAAAERRANVDYLDVSAALDDRAIFMDGVHLNLEGCRRLARALAPVVAR
jgi:lysophospholipase L1-like esterase